MVRAFTAVARVQSPVGERRSRKPHGVAKKIKNKPTSWIYVWNEGKRPSIYLEGIIFLFFFFFLAAPCGLWETCGILVSLTRDGTQCHGSESTES